LGTVFKITATGTLTTLYSFCSQPLCSDGAQPYAGLVQGTDGNFYGTTNAGTAKGEGTVFKITPGGKLTTLYSFGGPDGGGPSAGLVQATDGSFYGTTGGGVANGAGTVFKITPGGTLTTLHSFSGTDGAAPGTGGLIQATDGSFFGTTQVGGINCSPNGCGTVFSLSGATSPNPLQFVPVMPCRLLDTRGSGPIQGGTFQIFTLPQLAQMNHCDNLSTAAAYSLNVTVAPRGPLGYLTIWPAGRPQPLVSTLNSYDARVKAVAAIVPGEHRRRSASLSLIRPT
jgi:uncharacterized repeat protein (TIGR03803 family)